MYEFGRNFRPNLSAPDLGYYTVDDRPNPGCVEEARRRDTGPCTWGRGVIASITTRLAPDSLNTLATEDPRPLAVYQTERGPVALPYGPIVDSPFSGAPSVAQLQLVPFTGNRMEGISNRYYQ